MTNNDYTHLTLCVDRSGSMFSTQDDAQGAINDLFKDQRAVPGKLTLTLIQFDTQHDTLYHMTDINKVRGYELRPRGATALFDAVGNAIQLTGADLRKLAEDDRPGKVVVAIVTDGGENSSHEFNLETVKAMIKDHQDTWKWEFVFLGADTHAWQGVQMGSSVTRSYLPTGQGTHDVYAALSTNLGTFRGTVGGQSLSDTWVDNVSTSEMAP